MSNDLYVLVSDKMPYPEYITNKVHQLPLDIDIWVKEILNHKGSRDKEPAAGIEKYDSISMASRYLFLYE